MTLYIWALPGTINSSQPWNSVGNPFKTLANFSLDLVSQDMTNGAIGPVVDFLDAPNPGGVKVFSPSFGPTSKRFEYVNDSTTGDPLTGPPLVSGQTAAGVLAGAPDQLENIQGFSIDTGNKGIGPNCDPSDSYCHIPPAGSNSSPAWLIASVAFDTLKTGGRTGLYLRIGYDGMNYVNEPPQNTLVEFGTDSNPLNAGNLAQRQINGDQPDLVVDSTLQGDYNGDGKVDASDYAVWRSEFGMSMMPGSGADGTGDGIIDAADFVLWRAHLTVVPGDYNHNGVVDAADYVIWRSSIGSTSNLAADGNGNGLIDLGDYGVWRTSFGQVGGIGAPANAATAGALLTVPEPDASRLIGLVLILFVLLRNLNNRDARFDSR